MSIQAAEKLFLTGAEVTTASTTYLYLGTSIPLPESNLGKGFVLHLWADYQTYSYEAGTIDIDVDIKGLSAAIGYHDSGEDNWWNVRLGVVRSDTSLSPDDPGNDSVGTDSNLKLQLEGEKRMTADYKMVGNFEYIFDRSAYWTRGRFLSRNDDNTYDGPELIYQGDDSYSAYQLGWILTEMPVSKDWSMGLKAGFRFDENDTAAYAGIELSTLY
jgi:hypothetical protein